MIRGKAGRTGDKEVNQFSFTLHSEIFRKRLFNEYFISPIIRKDEDMALYFDYSISDKYISQEKAKDLVIELRKELQKKYSFMNAVRSSNIFL